MLKRFFNKGAPVSKKPAVDLSGLLERRYQEKVANNHIRQDDAQSRALQKLQALLEGLPDYADRSQQFGRKRPPSEQREKCRSLYIYGDVGRGKSMLMDLFYEACPIRQKRRVHFLAFMQEVHRFVHQWRQRHKGDALPALARKIRESTLLLCFDEFHITDIADAMILVGLFGQLFDLGLVVVITSNRHPYELYRGGLLREQFIPFVSLLEATSDIIELVAREDYRLSKPQGQLASYYFPLGQQASELINASYRRITGSAAMTARTFEVLGREFTLSAANDNTAVASFDQLCTEAFGPADYLKIATEFTTLIITDIPKLTGAKRNEAKRFVTLIDALYEHKVKLICSAEVPAHELYTDGDGSFEFQRTVSRLIEMQSESYRQS